MTYSNLFVETWHNSEPRPTFQKPVYFFEYDGTNHAYRADGNIWSFLFWVAGIIQDETTEQQDDMEADDDFLNRAGVNYGYWDANI